MISVLIVDDDTETAEALGELCNTTPDLRFAGSASTTPEALRLVNELKPDVVLADVRMPGPDGIELARALGRGSRSAGPKIVMLTAFPHDDYLLAALGAGASGFLPKSAPWPEVADAVRSAQAGGAFIPPALTRRLVDLVMSPSGDAPRLTKRESEVLAAVGAGQTNEQIAKACYMSVGTVRTHLEHLRLKLGLASRVELALAARRLGLGYTWGPDGAAELPAAGAPAAGRSQGRPHQDLVARQRSRHRGRRQYG